MLENRKNVVKENIFKEVVKASVKTKTIINMCNHILVLIFYCFVFFALKKKEMSKSHFSFHFKRKHENRFFEMETIIERLS